MNLELGQHLTYTAGISGDQFETCYISLFSTYQGSCNLQPSLGNNK